MKRLSGSISKFAASVVVAVLAVVLAPTTPALAAGDAGLQAEIVGDPLHRGVPLPSDFLGPFASSIQKAENDAVSGSGVSASVAALGWTVPGAKPKRSFIVALSSIDWPGQSATVIDQQTALAAKSAAATTCAGELGSPPKTDVTMRGIPSSHYFVCQRAPDGSVLEGLTTARQNVFAILITDTAAFSKHNLEVIGLRQYRALHIPEPPASA